MKLYGRLGSGSGAVEAILRVAGIDCEMVDFDRWPEGQPPAELTAANPLGEVPTLVRDDGSVMTESAAICIYLSDLHSSAGLSPAPVNLPRWRRSVGAPGRRARSRPWPR